MHFTTLFVLKNAKLEELTPQMIEELFCERYCYCNGETSPKYLWWCDWFQIGGRWSDILTAKNGVKGERSWANKDEDDEEGKFSIVNIEDLTEPLPRQLIYSVATKSRIYTNENGWQVGAINDEDKYNQMLDDIDNKKYKGVIALIDCHD